MFWLEIVESMFEMRSLRIYCVVLLVVLGSLALETSARAVEKPAARPNILFIFTDDQSHRSVGCYPEAHPWVKTPHIDRLAAEGIRFEYAYVGTWCMPSRAQMLTGLHPHAIASMKMSGPYPGSSYDPARCRFWPAEFRRAGYCTGMIGKWHTGGDTGFGRDWDYQAVWNHAIKAPGCNEYYNNQPVSINGAPAEIVPGYSTDNYTGWAVDFIRGTHRDPGKPWYLWLCYGAVHGPYTPSKRHAGDYSDTPPVPVPEDIYPPRPTKPRYMQQYGVWKRGANGRPVRGKSTLDDAVRKYNRAVRALDEGVGKLVAALEETGQRDNTLVIYTSDQGFAWGQHGYAWKYGPYDANLRVPLIASMPGSVPQGQVCSHPVGGLDLIPTFFATAGVRIPWDMHGHDLRVLLENPSAEWPHPVLLEQTRWFYGADTRRVPPPQEARWGGVPWWVSLRQGRYKYIRTLEADEIEELYDLSVDPQELHNLATEPEFQERLADYRRQCLAELARTEAEIVENLPAVRSGAGRE